MHKYKYETEWSGYAFPESSSRFASDEDIRTEFTRVDLSEPDLASWGIPILVDGQLAYVNDLDENTLICGESGSKKTRCVVAPLLATVAGAGGSAIVTDIKGELVSNPRVMRYIESKGVDVVCLDFRTFDADGYNILEYAAELYADGKTDKAMANVNRVVSAMTDKYEGSRADPYWHLMGSQHITGIIEMLLDICKKEPEYKKYVNVLSIASFANESGTRYLEEFIDENYHGVCHNSILMLKGVLSTPDRTKSSIVSVTNSLLKDIIIQPNLTQMLSHSTFDLSSMYEKPTIVFLVVPDETSAYDGIAGLLIDIFYAQLVEVFTERYQNRKKPPCDIAWICEEACNVRIGDMRAKLSACRSRSMKFYIIVQSLRQLEETYTEDAATIIGNCKNQFLLQTSDPELMEYFSRLSGTTNVSVHEGGEPLLPPEKIRLLKKSYEYKEAIFVRGDCIYLATLPDIDTYEFLKPFGSEASYELPRKGHGEVEAYSPERLISDVANGKIGVPFKESTAKKKNVSNNGSGDSYDLQRELEAKFEELFGNLNDDDDEEDDD